MKTKQTASSPRMRYIVVPVSEPAYNRWLKRQQKLFRNPQTGTPYSEHFYRQITFAAGMLTDLAREPEKSFVPLRALRAGKKNPQSELRNPNSP